MVSTGWGGCGIICGIGSTLSAPVSSFVGPASSKLSDSGRTFIGIPMRCDPSPPSHAVCEGARQGPVLRARSGGNLPYLL